MFENFSEDVLQLIAKHIHHYHDKDDKVVMQMMLNFVNSSSRTYRLFGPVHKVWDFTDEMNKEKRYVVAAAHKGCQRCGYTLARKIYNPWAFRLCKNCYEDITITCLTLKQNGFKNELFTHLPAIYTSRGSHKRVYKSTCNTYRRFLKRDVAPIINKLGKKFKMVKKSFDKNAFAKNYYVRREPFGDNDVIEDK